MCGRYSLTSPVESVAKLFGFDERPNLAARFNIAPTQSALIVRGAGIDRPGEGRTGDSQVGGGQIEGGQVEGVTIRWGLTPPWAKNLDEGVRMINARAESVRDKPAFRAAYEARRCLAPTDGFYEWRKSENGQQPFRISMRDNSVFAFAGLWERWRAPDGVETDTFSLLTTTASPLLASIHHRMPVILAPADYAVWINGTPEAASVLMRPYEDDSLRIYPVGARVGNVRNDDPDLWTETPEKPPAPRQLSLL